MPITFSDPPKSELSFLISVLINNKICACEYNRFYYIKFLANFPPMSLACSSPRLAPRTWLDRYPGNSKDSGSIIRHCVTMVLTCPEPVFSR